EIVNDPGLVGQGVSDRVEVSSEFRRRELVARRPCAGEAALIGIAVNDVVVHERVRSHRNRRPRGVELIAAARAQPRSMPLPYPEWKAGKTETTRGRSDHDSRLPRMLIPAEARARAA